MRNLVFVAITAGGLYLLAKTRPAEHRPIPPPPTEREYHDRLAHLLEAAASYGDRDAWERVAGECRAAGRADLPGHVRRRWPEFSERLDRG